MTVPVRLRPDLPRWTFRPVAPKLTGDEGTKEENAHDKEYTNSDSHDGFALVPNRPPPTAVLILITAATRAGIISSRLVSHKGDVPSVDEKSNGDSRLGTFGTPSRPYRQTLRSLGRTFPHGPSIITERLLRGRRGKLLLDESTNALGGSVPHNLLSDGERRRTVDTRVSRFVGKPVDRRLLCV